MHRLIILLGKGQENLSKETARNYRTAKYYIDNNKSNYITSPFVGEAIIRLINKYDILHIIGTKESMWEQLFFYCIKDNLNLENEKIWNQVFEVCEKKELKENTKLTNIYENKIADYLGVQVKIHIIDTGKDVDEMWNIFEEISSIPNNGDTISLDITHGLRFQPILVTLALIYFKSLFQKIIIDEFFYGAFELQNKQDELTPIMRLGEIIKMLDWINAANSFKKYGDITAINSLLNTNTELINAINDFSNDIKLNRITKLRENTENLISKINYYTRSNKSNDPFNYIKKSLIEFPELVKRTDEDWRLLIILAKRNWTNGFYALSAMEAWEAIINRAATLKNIKTARSLQNYQKVSNIEEIGLF
ncbi:MAG TPA: TIGR02221 family CRISPR-associated protein [Melioribacteraceae bacterium]|nr:TIGR02221 family CRISPR-associated protein [Melioribacteraceae bacterium]